jgi:uncharacterized protein (TIGR03083 family)
VAGWDFERYCERLQEQTDRLAADIQQVVAGGKAGLPVATCPGWTIADVIGHTGGVHRWAEHMVATRATERADRGDIKVNFPDDPARYPGWLTDGVAALTATLRAAGPQAPVWTFAPDHRAFWWARRMVHETAVHGADVVLAVDRVPRFDPEQSADGIDELLALFPYSPRTHETIRALPAGGESIHLHATDCDGEWMIRLTPGGMTWERGHGKGTVAVRGPVGTLFLFAYGRAGANDPALGADSQALEVLGDRDLLADWTVKTAL